MKHFLARACAKIGRFFWSWGFLKFILWSVTLIILFYAEEDWRGARAWAATKAEWEAKGESFDYNKLIPPPVPDDENLAAIPLFKLVPNPTKGPFEPDLIPVGLHYGFTGDLQHDLPRAGNWQAGKLSDPIKIRKGIADMYAEAFKGAKPPGDALAQLDALYPFLTDLRIASATRPFCRFSDAYVQTPTLQPPVTLFTEQIALSDILELRVLLELDDHQSDPALTDLKINFKLMSGMRKNPSYVAGQISIAMDAIMDGALYDGLARHDWNDAQLAELQDELNRIDFLSVYQHDLRSEAVGEAIPFFDFLKKSRSTYFFEIIRQGLGSVPLSMRLLSFWPDGWLDQNKRQRVTYVLNCSQSVDPKTHLVFPKIADDLSQQKTQADARRDAWAPWNCFFTISNHDWDRTALYLAIAQVRVDHMRLACALERYRLAHNAYPDSLDALVPDCIDELPHDIFNGQPYHYRLRPDGTFLLYSVGWNQTDDGGKVVYKYNNSGLIDYTQGDWVWPTVQPASAK